MASASVFQSVRNIVVSSSLACSRLRRAIVARREAQDERRAASDFTLDDDRAVELFHDTFGNGQAEAEAPALGGDEVVEDRREPVGGDARSRVRDSDFDLVAVASGRD